MHPSFNRLLSLSLLISTMAFAADGTTAVTPYLSFRSQGENAARELSGWSNHINKINECSHYGSFSVTPDYSQSFNNKKIAENLFGCYYLQDCNKLTISGSAVANRGEKDLLADWFYLPDDYQGSISFAPRIQNVNIDLDFYWGMDAFVQGMFLRIHSPITWTKWDLGAKFTTTNNGTLVQSNYTQLTDTKQFFCDKDVMVSALSTNTTTLHPLTSARFCDCFCESNKTKTRLADIQADLGWNFIRENRGHLGLFVRAAAPTGNRPQGRWLFEPIVGNGHHWELGGGLTSSLIFWNNEDATTSVGLYVDANITHLFNALQFRVFDLKNKPLSRYMTGYKSNLPEVTSLANLTATTINSSIPIQADIVAMINGTWKNWTGDIGYNFWATTREILRCSHWTNTCYAKGVIKNTVFISDNIPDNWTFDRDSDIHEFVEAINYNPVLTDADIDYDSPRTKGMSHKVFGHAGYSWNERELIPFIGIGGEAEFGRNTNCCKTSCTNNCATPASYVSLSQWGVWMKGGISF